MTKLFQYLVLVLSCLLTEHSFAGLVNLDQEVFYGQEASKGKTLTITFRPDYDLYLIDPSEGECFSFSSQNGLRTIIPVAQSYEQYTNAALLSTQYDDVNWVEMFRFSASLAASVSNTSLLVTHDTLQFSATDPIFSRVAGILFRYKKYKTIKSEKLKSQDMSLWRLIFEQVGGGSGLNNRPVTIAIDLRVNFNIDETRSFSVLGIGFYENEIRVDGFYTAQYSELYALASAENRPSGGNDSSRSEPGAPEKKDPTNDAENKQKTGSSNKHFRQNSGWGGGGGVCSLTYLYLFSTVMAAPVSRYRLP